MSIAILSRRINLQLFAEGSGTGAEGTTGVTGTAAASQQGVTADSGAQAAAAQEVDRNAQFEALIKGEYKDLYDARVQDTVQKRLKGTRETVERYEALAPTLEMLAKKYGVKDVNDIAAINAAIEEDDAYYEEEALQKGVTVEQLKEIRKMERENADLKRRMQEQSQRENANKQYSAWLAQAEETKGVYPAFDLEAELQNGRFVDLISNNIDVRTAYEVIHKDEIVRGAMQFAAQKASQKVAADVASNRLRPAEHGASGQSPASTGAIDVSGLSDKQIEQYINEARGGKRINFR